MSALWVKYIQNDTHGIEQNLIYNVDQNINAVVIQRKGGGNDKLFIEWKQKIENENNFSLKKQVSS